jgi:hypothetical protein
MIPSSQIYHRTLPLAGSSTAAQRRARQPGARVWVPAGRAGRVQVTVAQVSVDGLTFKRRGRDRAAHQLDPAVAQPREGE